MIRMNKKIQGFLENEIFHLSSTQNRFLMELRNKHSDYEWTEENIILKEEPSYHPIIAMMEYADKTAELSDVLFSFIDRLGYMEEGILDCLFPVC